MTFDNSMMLSGTRGTMPPCWGLEFISDAACYKHAAPPALVCRRLSAGNTQNQLPQLRRSVMFIETVNQLPQLRRSGMFIETVNQ